MSPTLEIEGKNIDQAIQKACQQLKLSRKELEYDVLSYGSSGIFGLGKSRKARIRVRTTGAASRVVNTRGDIAGGAKRQSDPDFSQPFSAPPPDRSESQEKTEDADTSLGMGKEVLQRIVDSITDDARVHVEEQTERVLFRVEGGNAAILIGKHGQTLEAIQSLIDKVVNKNNSNRIRIQVDVGGYLQNRKKRLIRNAERLAQKCRRTQRPVSAGLLNAYERRIVHIALKDNDSVLTRSTGDGLLRNLMILPRKAGEGRQRKR